MKKLELLIDSNQWESMLVKRFNFNPMQIALIQVKTSSEKKKTKHRKNPKFGLDWFLPLSHETDPIQIESMLYYTTLVERRTPTPPCPSF